MARQLNEQRSATPPARPAALPRAPWRALAGRQELLILGLCLLAASVLSLLSANFLQATNLLNLARGVSWFAVLAALALYLLRQRTARTEHTAHVPAS